MRQRVRFASLLTVLGLLVSSCAGDRPTLAEEPATTSSTVPEPLNRNSAERVTSRLDEAVENLLQAPAYRFEATITLALNDDHADIGVHGWVEGADRELVLRTEAGEAITRVIDGVATVERNGETIEVPLQSASTPPSLEVLTRITDVSWAPGDTVQGFLSVTALHDLGFDVDGEARVNATVADGVLSYYKISAVSDAWTITTRFSDIGEAIS